MLKIGFDAKRLFNNFTGLGNYSRTVVQGLNEQYPNHEYHLFTTKKQNKPDTETFLLQPYKIHEPNTIFKNLWRTKLCTKEINKINLDIFHGLSHELPIGINKTSAKSVVTIHDLIYKTYPNDFRLIDRSIYDYKFRHACEKSNKIVAVSESTKNDLQAYYHIPEEKIEVVYQSCQPNFKVLLSDIEIETTLSKYNLPKKYLLYVGSIIERKNLLGIVKALNKLKNDMQLPLVVVGKGKDYQNKVEKYIAKHQLKEKIIFTSEVSFIDLPAIYQNASIFIYPSVYEGFGIPLIEALWSNTPAITSNISSLPEAAGPGAYYCDPHDENSIAEGIDKILHNPEYSKQLVNDGFEYVQRFESSINAKKMMEIYKNLLNQQIT
ncbi:MAG: glycosyltransferase family 1 protein [Salinivirgaceae bacterium]|jgi:glycosyltransferase involved in cell wall biosynthesis|nr:glycosyltransferase family 1 protein [Salinivirgaceae bacterium]